MTALYLHIPFCRRKCSYCDFYSIEALEREIQDYPALLKQHLAWIAKRGDNKQIDTIYFGGGTPSLLAPEAVASILQAIDYHFNVTRNAEITLEANPGTVSEPRLADYRMAGINRLSLGLQSCNDKQLVNLGRLHTHHDGVSAYKSARNAGFDNISLDLIFALPEQTFVELEEDLGIYLELAPEHLSCYGLTAEPGTPLLQRITSGTLSLPDEDFYADAFMLIHERLTAAGYEHYEIANYARDGYASHHNLGYWHRRSCLGIGAGAHSFQCEEWGSRWEVPTDLTTYRQTLQAGLEPSQCLEIFDRDSALRETIYLALRTRRGITDAELQQQFGCTLQQAFPEAVAASAQWLVNDNGRWSLTPSSWLLYDHLILPFL